jgi:hypothetical protein
MRTIRLALVLLAALSACPATEEQPPPDVAATPCPAYLAWEKKCAADAEQGPFWGETECPKPLWSYVQSAVLKAMVGCLEALPCDSSDDTCTNAGLAAIGIHDPSDVADNALYQTCMARTHECKANDDACMAFLLFTEAGRTKAAKCLDVACDRLDACLNDPDAS